MQVPASGERVVMEAIITITSETGFAPDVPELAEALGISTRQVLSSIMGAKRRGDVAYDENERLVLMPRCSECASVLREWHPASRADGKVEGECAEHGHVVRGMINLDPHRPEERFRLYRLRDELECVAACADPCHVVGMIADQRDPDAGATLLDDDAVGLLDAHGFRKENPLDERGNYTLPGSWLIKPWNADGPRGIGGRQGATGAPR